MHFESSITLGALVTIGVNVLLVVFALGVFKARTEALMKHQEQLLTALNERFNEHESHDDRRFESAQKAIFDMAGHLQRLIGQVEMSRKGDRRGFQ